MYLLWVIRLSRCWKGLLESHVVETVGIVVFAPGFPWGCSLAQAVLHLQLRDRDLGN